MLQSLSHRLRPAGITAALSFALPLPGCADDATTAPTPAALRSPATPQSTTVTLPPVQPGDSAAADTLGRAVALALAEPALRQLVLADLRDSPFAKHGIDLSSYLRAARGHAVAGTIAQRTGVTVDRLLAMASVRGGLQLFMPIASDRANWTGSDSVVVTGTPFTVKEEVAAQHRPFGYTVHGDTISTPLLEPTRLPLIVVGPAEHSFGPDPEATRSAAPKHSRRTITTFAEERLAMYIPPRAGAPANSLYIGDCNPETADTPCEPPPGGGSPGLIGAYLPSGGTMGSCTPHPGSPMDDLSQDQDRDGVQDQCEYELALAFRPQIQFDERDCNTGHEPYWAANYQVSPIDGQPVITIFYAISYYYDCGSPLPVCPISRCDPHDGDSEFIVLEVSTVDYPTYDGPHWMLKRATLSTHYASRYDGANTYAAGDLEYGNAAQYSNPLIWSASGKHANYRSQSVCDAGGFSTDNCDRPLFRVALETRPDANLGSYANQLITYVGSRAGSPGVEYMWSTSATVYPFLGWYPRSDGGDATPYGKILQDFNF